MPLQYDPFQYAKPGPYHTQLDPVDEMKFRVWVHKQNIPYDYMSNPATNDYDMRGFWKANPDFIHEEGAHFPDTYKTPYHESFSNESQWATKDAPAWDGNRLINKQGNIVFSDPVGDQ